MSSESLPARALQSGAVRVLPAAAGVGLKARHYQAFLDDAAAPAFIEVHAENFMGAGGAPHAWLARLHDKSPLSLHGVGLSLGGESPLDQAHIDRLAALIGRYQPESFSEHLAWSSHGGSYFNDLLPIPYDGRTLQRVCQHIDQVQSGLGLRMLLENPATYVEFEASTWAETDFIAELIRRTGCGLLLDVNNAYVSCINHGRDPGAYLAALPLQAVGEIHLSGHGIDSDGNGDPLLIDSHGSPVADAVWALYSNALDRVGPMATLIEWDNEVPEYEVLRFEARRADRILESVRTVMLQ
nr:DUF692 domain-containing protein [Arenimonas sp.]